MTAYDLVQIVADNLLAHMLDGARRAESEADRAAWCCAAVGFASR